MFSVSRVTVVRWLRYFRSVFPASDTWHRLKGLLSFPADNREVPSILFEYLLHAARSPAKALVKCLRLIAGEHAV